MYSVVDKNGSDTRKKARRVVIHTRKFSDDVDGHFYYNPTGDADFAARVVAMLADMNNYLARIAPSGVNKIGSRRIHELCVRIATLCRGGKIVSKRIENFVT